MPNINDHTTTAFSLTGITCSIINLFHQEKEIELGIREQIDIYEILGNGFLGGFAGAIGSLIPDLLDPPNNPNHRKLFHSFFDLLFSIYLISNSSCSSNKYDDIAIKSFITGNIIHIIQDSSTPKGIPIF
jgi:hypothetical protein